MKTRVAVPAVAPLQLLLFAFTLVLVLPSTPGYSPGCKEYLGTCLDQLPAILARQELKSIPTTQEELDTSCRAFTTGMNCVDNFTANCLEKEKQKWVDNAVAGAKATFQMLCRNKEFRQQYLAHSRCFRMTSVTEGWDTCAGRFINIVQTEMARKNATAGERIVELCCAKHGFLKCVYGTAKHKCGSASAVFLRRIAETLASVRVEEKYCKFVNATICSRAPARGDLGLLVAVSTLCVLARRTLGLWPFD